MTIWFASGNIHKKKELADILSSDILSSDILSGGISLVIPSEAGLKFEPEETGNTFLENALIKAEALYRLLEERRPSLYKRGDPIIADDSGICVDALGGRPGIHSARYGGHGASAAEKNAMLLAELGDNARRSARFICAMVLYYGAGRFSAAQECLEGELVKDAESARGSGGFGYDPILYIPELGRTVAELGEEEKNSLSHRGKAGKIILNILRYTEHTSCGASFVNCKR
jgi:XTP/dITP diphosphohydrolase